MMAGVEHKYFRKGVSKQKRCDISVSLKRPNMEDIRKWSEEERKGILDYIEQSKKYFDSFSESLKQSIKPNC